MIENILNVQHKNVLCKCLYKLYFCNSTVLELEIQVVKFLFTYISS